MKILTLNLKREWFEAIKNGTKTEEYREYTKFWRTRLEGKSFDKIKFCLGYPKKDDASCILWADWLGYTLENIIHPHFDNKEIAVFAINFKLNNEVAE